MIKLLAILMVVGCKTVPTATVTIEKCSKIGSIRGGTVVKCTGTVTRVK